MNLPKVKSHAKWNTLPAEHKKLLELRLLRIDGRRLREKV